MEAGHRSYFTEGHYDENDRKYNIVPEDISQNASYAVLYFISKLDDTRYYISNQITIFFDYVTSFHASIHSLL